MSNLSDDLDLFLKSDGVRIIMDKNGTRTEPYTAPTIEGYGRITDIDPESMDESTLNDLLDKAEDIKSDLEDQLSDIEDLIDRIEDRLDELEE